MNGLQVPLFEKNKTFTVNNDNPIQIVVPVSGGKDSQSCMKLAVNAVGADRVLGVYCDTQFEHPSTYMHLNKIEQLYGVKIERLCVGSVEKAIRKHKRFPGGGARHCTGDLKIKPSIQFYKQFAQNNGGFEIWYGVRGAESHERATRYGGKIGDEVYQPHEYMAKFPKYLGKAGVLVRLPIVDWHVSDVFDYLDGEQHWLYSQGFDRVGCFPCLASGDEWKRKAFEFDATGRAHFSIIQALAAEIKKPIFEKERRLLKKQAQQQESNGCSFCMW